MIYDESRRCRDPDQAGFTLVEVMVATMISAMMVTGFFSIALTSRVSTSRSDHKLAANQNIRRVLQKLRNYVADPTGYNLGIGTLKMSTKKMAEDTSTATWALQTGIIHDVTAIMQDDESFYDATNATWKVANQSLTYCVADFGGSYNCGTNFGSSACPGSGTAVGGKCVKVIIAWDEKGA